MIEKFNHKNKQMYIYIAYAYVPFVIFTSDYSISKV